MDNQQNNERNLNDHGDIVDSVGVNSTLSTMSPHTSGITEKKSYIQVCKEEELKLLIKKVSCNYGGDDAQFLADYISEVIKEWSQDLDMALACFRDLSRQNFPVINRK